MNLRRRDFLATTAALAVSSSAFCDEPKLQTPPIAKDLDRAANPGILSNVGKSLGNLLVSPSWTIDIRY